MWGPDLEHFADIGIANRDGDVKDIVLSFDGRHEAVAVPYRGFDSS